MAISLKTDPKYGYFPWWPENGDQWVHPEDVEIARSTIPSPRVWRRDGQQGEFDVFKYGTIVLRLRRTLWRELRWEGFDIGDMVEVRTRGMNNEHRTGTIREMHWDDHAGQVHYQLNGLDDVVENPILYTSSDLKHVEPTDPREEVRVEPPENEPGDAYEVDDLK